MLLFAFHKTHPHQTSILSSDVIGPLFVCLFVFSFCLFLHSVLRHRSHHDEQLTQNGMWGPELMNWLRVEIALCGCSAAPRGAKVTVASVVLAAVVGVAWNYAQWW
jgi:hypothetical protein